MDQVDLLGIGLGPANLSLAALAESAGSLRTSFLESKPEFRWHSGIMLPSAQLQVSYLKDLVTLVDPTSRFSFLNYLAHNGRIFRSLVANGTSCSRQEFEDYYRWAAGQLSSVRWNSEVREVSVRGDSFEVATADGTVTRTRNLVLGSGRKPSVPSFAQPLVGRSILHGSDILRANPETKGKKVLVVGAGQSGAEIVNYLLTDGGLPSSLTWISSRVGFLPIDDSPFTNEWFAPPYVDYFQGLTGDRRAELLSHQRLASDGISESLLRSIYRRLYDLDLARSGLRHQLLTSRRMVDLAPDGDRYTSTLHDADGNRLERCDADVVIFCTGYSSAAPAYLEPLRQRLLNRQGEFEVQGDYSLSWDGPPGLRVYVQNAAEATHGIADPNLSLASWRSARILNSVLGEDLYRLDRVTSTVTWESVPDRDRDGDLIAP
ncbi:lysine N(6)-hydroxylase/L-ornithine N(5)-oxygenase family protein [Streptomyces sp. NPDC058401]|uniref:lysine N(6)-hydroxylase/L-ornithine N(5)-oxygenase family protein n=1 Tax=Streptomyces sp. NPDC058401 TaxID=3346480 RepID=UPI00365F81F1